MYIGDFIKEYREANGVSIEDFATKAGLTVTEMEALENNLQEDGTVIPVAMRQIKGIAAATVSYTHLDVYKRQLHHHCRITLR